LTALSEIELLGYIESIFNKIPQQGPLEFFVHHNTLHHYEFMNFFDAVKVAAIEYNANAFMPEAFYAHKHRLGLIKDNILKDEIKRFLEINKLTLSPDIVYSLLITQKLNSNKKIKKEILEFQEKYFAVRPIYFSQIIKDDYGIDIDFYANDTIYRFLSNYFDYGTATWALQHRERGMWYHFCQLHPTRSFLESHYRKELSALIKRLYAEGPLKAILFIIEGLSVDKNETENYLFSVCIKHIGWAGFIKSIILHPEYVKNDEIIPDLHAFLAIVLLCEYAAILTFKKNKIKIPRDKKIPQHSAKFLARFIYQMNQYPLLHTDLLAALPSLSDLNRQEIYHRAYEKTLYQQLINAYLGNAHYIAPTVPAYQVILCMDDREESLRRYLEMDPACETYGSAGNFGLNIEYKGYFDKRYRALCPINVKPEFKISENAYKVDRFKLKVLYGLGELKWHIQQHSKSIVGGSIISLLSGIFSIIPLILDVIEPRAILFIKKKVSKFFSTAIATELNYKKEAGVEHGIDVAMRENFAESLLSLIGLTQSFAPYIFIIGHGSMSLNNPHRAAYDCGACGGGIGATNARLMAKILNEQQVRQALRQRHIDIPEECQFVGAYHNTCSDEIEFYDIPHDNELNKIITKIRYAAILESKERSRRFSDLPLNRKPEYYYKSVQARSLDLRQPRAEYGHSTNAFFIIGPREYTHHLFLDRRSFLLSYDPKQDPELSILTKLLTATIPVVSGVNLEYYFSYIDNEFYGAGTKLPHNVNALVGVMNGHLSDLRAGLPWQMVEIHQPVRLFLLVIADIDKVRQLLSGSHPFSQKIKNEWINFSVHDLKTNTLWIYKNNDFVQCYADGLAPNYLQHDPRILSSRHHIEIGTIYYGD